MTHNVTEADSFIDSKVLHVSEESPGYLRAIIDNPPLNILDGAVFAGLELLRAYVQDSAAKVVVFESADPDFFITRLDLAGVQNIPDLPGAADIVQAWPTFSNWLNTAPVVSIAKVRGCARGIGDEFVCACDLRFASLEKARFAQHEIGRALVPGGGGLEWLPRHVGRSRALEIVLSGDDFDAATAELYGLVNRALPDAQLDEFVDLLARRIASFDAHALATAKQLINDRSGVPAVDDLRQGFGVILELGQRPESRKTYEHVGAWSDTRYGQRVLPRLLG